MKRLFSAKFLAASLLALGALGAASVAEARTDVFFSIGVPGAYVESAPVYVQPQPVYVPPPVYAGPSEVYVQRPVAPVFGYSYDNEQAWRRAEWQRRAWRHHEWEEHHRQERDWR